MMMRRYFKPLEECGGGMIGVSWQNTRRSGSNAERFASGLDWPLT
jgi:hypothetical protein